MNYPALMKLSYSLRDNLTLDVLLFSFLYFKQILLGFKHNRSLYLLLLKSVRFASWEVISLKLRMKTVEELGRVQTIHFP